MARHPSLATDLADHPARAVAASWGEHLRRDRRRSEHTIRAYVATAQRWVGFLGQHRGAAIDIAGLAQVEAAELRAFLAARRD